MTFTAARTTEYIVTFCWVAEAWAYEAGESGDAPMSSSDPVTVALPTGSSPWDVYSKAQALIKGPETNSDVSGWDDDGMTIFYDGKLYSLPGSLMAPETQWSDFC